MSLLMRYIKTFENFSDWDDEEEEEDLFIFDNGVIHINKTELLNFFNHIGYVIVGDIDKGDRAISFKVDINPDMKYSQIRVEEERLFNIFSNMSPYFHHNLIDNSRLLIVFDSIVKNIQIF